MNRQHVPAKTSQRSFANGARPHPKNLRTNPMRGGIRL